MSTVSQVAVEQSGSPERGFEQLHRRTQIGRMRHLALVALAAYDLPPVRLTLLAHLFNTTFRVDTANGQRYVLRINRAGAPTVESVGAELAWLIALRRDTPSKCPRPCLRAPVGRSPSPPPLLCPGPTSACYFAGCLVNACGTG